MSFLFKIGKPFRRYHIYTDPYNLEQDIRFLVGEENEPSDKGNALGDQWSSLKSTSTYL